MSDKKEPFIKTYSMIKTILFDYGYGDEINHVDSLRLENQTEASFFKQYVFVVLSTAISNQAAESMFQKFMESAPYIEDLNADLILHLTKRKAINEAKSHYKEWFQRFKNANDKIAFLEILPFIGPVTKFHLARNLGLDVVKPDRHLVRLANYLSFESPNEMCKYIAERTNDRLGTVDVVLWRACNLHLIDSMKLEVEEETRK